LEKINRQMAYPLTNKNNKKKMSNAQHFRISEYALNKNKTISSIKNVTYNY